MNHSPKTSTLDKHHLSTSDSILDIFSSQGRLGRVRFLTYSLSILTIWAAINAAISVILQLYYPGWNDMLQMCMIFISVMASVLGIIVCKRRLNDFNASGWWMLIFFVPIAFPVMLILMLLMPGTKGENRFGGKAIENSTSVYVVLLILLTLLLGATIL